MSEETQPANELIVPQTTPVNTEKHALPKKEKRGNEGKTQTKKIPDRKVSVSPEDRISKEQQPLITALSDNLGSFIHKMRSLGQVLPVVLKSIEESRGQHFKDFMTFLRSSGIVGKKGSPKGKRMDLALAKKVIRHSEDFSSRQVAYDMTPSIYHISLVCAYDAFLGSLLKTIFTYKGDVLKSSQRELTVSDLSGFRDMRQAIDYIIEQEVESVIRESHSKQIEWMEGKFGLSLRKDLAIWPDFIEITERRNIFVHCDGFVSSQYADVCKRHGVKLGDDFAIGRQLKATPKYFHDSLQCLLEMGIKLHMVLTRKLFPDLLVHFDMDVIDKGYELLINKEYKLASIIFDFAANGLKKHSSDMRKRIMTINHCTALMHLGGQEYKKILDQHDWSSCSHELHMVVHALRGEFSEAEKIMHLIGRAARPSDEDYREWPALSKFRESENFRRAYKKIFRREYKPDVVASAETTAKAVTSGKPAAMAE